MTLRREDLIRALPYARRYARALTGSQPAGDALVADCLRGMLAADRGEGDGAAMTDARHALYRGVTRRLRRVWRAGAAGAAGAAAPILDVSPDVAAQLLGNARERLRASAATDVLIIEDEPIIAMDLEELVQSCGHRVVGVASSEAEAIKLAAQTRPGLILADINLGLGGAGTSAVSAILASHYAPVIFVTAYPERLLTGDAIEPAFVITKPFEPLTLAIATYQAVTGGVQLDSV